MSGKQSGLAGNNVFVVMNFDNESILEWIKIFWDHDLIFKKKHTFLTQWDFILLIQLCKYDELNPSFDVKGTLLMVVVVVGGGRVAEE